VDSALFSRKPAALMDPLHDRHLLIETQTSLHTPVNRCYTTRWQPFPRTLNNHTLSTPLNTNMAVNNLSPQYRTFKQHDTAIPTLLHSQCDTTANYTVSPRLPSRTRTMLIKHTALVLCMAAAPTHTARSTTSQQELRGGPAGLPAACTAQAQAPQT
jgi:hypothetical protein